MSCLCKCTLQKNMKMKPLPKNTSKSTNPLFVTCLKMGVNAKVIGQGVGALVMLYTKSTHVFPNQCFKSSGYPHH